jgi:hypothetical protein
VRNVGSGTDIYDGYGLRDTELIFNCKQMNIIDLSVFVKSNRLQKINEIKTDNGYLIK